MLTKDAYLSQAIKVEPKLSTKLSIVAHDEVVSDICHYIVWKLLNDHLIMLVNLLRPTSFLGGIGLTTESHLVNYNNGLS